MLTKNFLFKDFNKKRKNKKILKYLNELIYSKIEVINSLSHNYKYSYTKKFIKKLNKYKFIRIFGMGGSSLGAHGIYDFLKHKIKKNFKIPVLAYQVSGEYSLMKNAIQKSRSPM